MMRGYLEGYYGRLLSWQERADILLSLQALGMNAYVYAPKEDVQHRLFWREPYSTDWREAFGEFCRDARSRGIDVIAGVAPGIDFEFRSLDGGADLDVAFAKLSQLRDDGASGLMLLMDDIDADFAERNAGLGLEGCAHASLANRLGDMLGESLVVVPRVYAAELASETPAYLGDFARTLDSRHTVSACGSDIVSRRVAQADIHPVPGDEHRKTILWDNLYCNDYCPRRLFVGDWTGRAVDIDSIWLNGTGLVETDRLLLSMMQAAAPESGEAATEVRRRHGVPPAFDLIASAFAHPTTNDALDQPLVRIEPTDAVLAAVDELLWRWKTPLSREWYPYLMGLRQDLLMAAHVLPDDRVRKTQLPPLARRILLSDDVSTSDVPPLQ